MFGRTLLSSAIVLAGGLFASGAFANTGEEGATLDGVSFSQLDQDGDGYISESEMQQADAEIAMDHTTLDVNGDGQVDETEFAAFEKESKDAMGAMGEKAMGEHGEYSEETDY